MPTLVPPRPSHVARERVIEVLSHSFADDRLATEEFELRVQLAYRAATSMELERLIADLPSTMPNAPNVSAAQSTGRITAFLSSNERSGSTVVPAHLEINVLLGNVELDLRSATFASVVTHINVESVLGSVEIMLPPGMHVECNGNAIVGSFGTGALDALDASGSPRDATRSIVRVTGYAILSSVEIKATHQTGHLGHPLEEIVRHA